MRSFIPVVLLALLSACVAFGPDAYKNPVPTSELFRFGDGLVVWVPDYGFETSVDLDEALYQCSVATNKHAPHGFRICTNIELVILSEQTTYADSLINECFWSFEQANQNSFSMFCFANQADPSKWLVRRVFSLDDAFSGHINGLSVNQLDYNFISLSNAEPSHSEEQPGAYIACCASETLHQVQTAEDPAAPEEIIFPQ